MTDQQTLNFQENTNDILECRDRIADDYPIYLPRSSSLSKKIAQKAHKKTLHGGPTLAISEVTTKYWIPKLRQLAKRVIRHFYGCKKHHLKAYSVRQQGQLPTDKTVGERAFELKSLVLISLNPFTTKQRKVKKTRVISFSSPAV